MGSRHKQIVRLLGVAAMYTALLACVTYPQIRGFAGAIANDVDPYFSIWRLAWVAHQLPSDPVHLFDANIFFPERHTLAYSDAMLGPGLVAAPLFWLHVNPALIYNLCLFAGFVLSGAAMYLLVLELTHDTAAAVAAGALFMCAPFRFDHYVHLELQLTFCMPIGLLALHRLLKTPQWRWAALVGVSLAVQTLCSVYYGVFFGTFLAVVATPLLIFEPRRLGRRLVLLFAAAGLAAVVVAPYMPAYFAARATVGARSESEVLYYSAQPLDYLSARADNALYGRYLSAHGGEERHLFPGVVILIGAALCLRRMSRATAAYLLAGVFVFDASLGLHGHVFPFLREFVLPYQGLRVPARFAILVVLSLSVCAGFGLAAISRGWPRAVRLLVAAVVMAGAGAEARTTPLLTTPPLHPSAVDVWLAAQPRSPILELPLPPADQPFQLSEGQHIYDSTFHWQPLVNGISGFWPASYLELLQRMRTFPDSESIAYLAKRRVRYIVVRQDYFTPDVYASLKEALNARPELHQAARFAERQRESVVFELR